MPFQKGHKGFRSKESYENANKDHFSCNKYKEKMRVIAKKKGYGKWMNGKKLTDETKKKIAKSNIGRRGGGWKLSKETREKMSASKKGEKSHLWKGGVTNKNTLIRQGVKYKQWREAVFERDDYTCVFCKKRGVKIQADHIKPFALFPKLRFDLSNGRTLCIPCHKKTPTYLASGKKLKEASA